MSFGRRLAPDADGLWRDGPRRDPVRTARRIDVDQPERAFDFSIPFADNIDAQIFFVARLPRTLAGAFVGATLATSGVVFQGLLRNPLATPFTLGVSAGGALGAMLAITFSWSLAAIGAVGRPAGRLRRFARRGRRRLRAGAARGIAGCRPTSCCWRASRSTPSSRR